MKLLYSDIPELEGSKSEVVLANLGELEYRMEKLLKSRIVHLSELSRAVIVDGGDGDIIKSILLSFKGEDDESVETDERGGELAKLYASLSLSERMLLIKKIITQYSYENFLCPERGREHELRAGSFGRVAYLKNSMTDSAYMQLSSLLDFPRAAYFGSIKEVCMNVHLGECEYCILPVETSADGKLGAFYDKIIEHGLKIVGVYDLSQDDGKRHTRFALLAASIYDETHGRVDVKTKAQYLEFAVRCEEYPTFGDILKAAEFCSMRLVRIDTLTPNGGGEDISPMLCPVFCIDGADLELFLTYLSIDCSNFLLLGIYKQI